MDTLPQEIINLILSELDVYQILKFCSSQVGDRKLCQNNELWLNNIYHRFGVNLTIERALSLLVNLFETNTVSNVNIGLLDIDKNTVTILGKIFLEPATTILGLVLEIHRRFGILGEIRFQIVNDRQSFTGDRYVGYHVNYSTFENDAYHSFDSADLLLPVGFPNPSEEDEVVYIDELTYWLLTPLRLIIPQLFPEDMEIIITKHKFTDRELNIITGSIYQARKYLIGHNILPED